MAWIAVGIAGAGMTASYLNNQEKKKQEKADMLANAEAMRYSPWTKMNPSMQTHKTGSDLSAAFGGALQGAAFGSQFHGAGAGATPTTSDDAAAAGGPGLGGAEMSKQLGAQGANFQNSMAPQMVPAPAPAAPEALAAQSPAYGMDMASNGASPGSPWSVMGNQKKSFYNR